MTRPLRRTLAASVATLSLLVLTGCGGNDDAEKAADGPASTSGSTTGSASASSSASPSTSAEPTPSDTGGGQPGTEISAKEFVAVVQKALDDATTANITISSQFGGGAGGIQGTGQVDYQADSPAVKMTATIAQAGDLQVILVGKKLYLKGAVFGSQKWVELPLDDPNSPLGAIGDQLDPAAALQKLLTGIQKATYVGEEDVDGDTLEHYTATVDTKTLLADLPAEAQGAVQLPATVDYQFWFDGDGLIRKFSVDLGAIGTSEGSFDDWGTKVDIAAPPADEITTLPGGGA